MKTILFLILTGATAFARVGETEKQIEDRYGKVVSTMSKPSEPLQKLYRFSGMQILVTYVDGVCQQEILVKQDQSEFTQTEVGSSRVDLQACKLEYSIVSPK